MNDLFNSLAILHPGVDYAVAVFEEGREVATRYVTVLIDGGSQHGAAMLAVPGRIVGASAKKRDAKRSSTDYHDVLLKKRPRKFDLLLCAI
jgi:hypothetical protein